MHHQEHLVESWDQWHGPARARQEQPEPKNSWVYVIPNRTTGDFRETGGTPTTRLQQVEPRLLPSLSRVLALYNASKGTLNWV